MATNESKWAKFYSLLVSFWHKMNRSEGGPEKATLKTFTKLGEKQEQLKICYRLLGGSKSTMATSRLTITLGGVPLLSSGHCSSGQSYADT